MDHFLPSGGGGGSAPARAQAADSRLLANLIRSEKDSMGALAQATSALHTAASALAAWGAAEGSGGVGATADMASTSAAVAGLLHAVADSQRTHVAAIDGYRAALKDVLAREESIRDVIRDRDILVGRLIKASKKRVKDTRIDAQTEKINDAQRELRACETVLAAEQAALVGVKRRTFKEALTMRAKTMGDVGNSMIEAAQETILLLDQFDTQRPQYYPDDTSTAYPGQPLQQQQHVGVPGQEFYPQAGGAPQQLIQPAFADTASTYQVPASYGDLAHASAGYADPNYAQSAQYTPSIYTNVGPGQQFVSSDLNSGVAPAPVAGAESYDPASVSAAPSVSIPTSTTGYPAVEPLDSAPPIEHSPAIPAPHRLNSQAGVGTDINFPSSEAGASEEAASAVPDEAVGDPTALATGIGQGDPGPPPLDEQQVDHQSALKAFPASATEFTAPSSAVVGSGGTPVNISPSAASVAPVPSSTLATGASAGINSSPSSVQYHHQPIATSPTTRLSDHQLAHLSPEQQQQYFAHQQLARQSYQPQPPVPAAPQQQPEYYSYLQQQTTGPTTTYEDQYSQYDQPVAPVAPYHPASYSGVAHPAYGYTPSMAQTTGRPPPPPPLLQNNYQPGTYQNSTSYQNALQGLRSDQTSGLSMHESSYASHHGRRASSQMTKKSNTGGGGGGAGGAGGFFGRVSKLFRTDMRDAADSVAGGHDRRSSQASVRSEESPQHHHGSSFHRSSKRDDSSDDDDRDAAAAYKEARARNAAGSGDGWHTRTDNNLRSIKGNSDGRSFLSRASNAVGRTAGGIGGANDGSSSSEEDEPSAAVHVNGQYASDTASTRTGKRSLLSRMSGKASHSATKLGGSREERESADARITPGPMSLRQHEAEIQRKAYESVVGAGIGRHQPPSTTTKADASLHRSVSTPAGSTPKRKVTKKVIKKPAAGTRPASRADSEPGAAAGGAVAKPSTSKGGSGTTTTIKRSSSMAGKPTRTLTVSGDASTGAHHSRIASAGHGTAAGKRSSVTPLQSDKYAISNWVSNSKDVPLASKPASHKPRTRVSSGNITSLSGGQVEGFQSSAPTTTTTTADDPAREKTPRPRTASGEVSTPTPRDSRPASRTNNRASFTPSTASALTPVRPSDAPLVVSAPPRTRDLLQATTYNGPRASTYASPTSAGVTALQSGADVNAAGQPNYLTHYNPPTEDARAGTATPTAGTRKQATTPTVRKVVKRSSTSLGTSAPTTTTQGPATSEPTTEPTKVRIKRRVSVQKQPGTAAAAGGDGITGKHTPASHDARPLSPAIKSPSVGEEVNRRKSVRMAPDTKFTEEPRPVSRTTNKLIKKKKVVKPGSHPEPPAKPAQPVVTVPFQVVAPGSSIVRADQQQPEPVPLAANLHSNALPLPSGRSQGGTSGDQQGSRPARPASAPAPTASTTTPYVARAPGSSLSGMGFIPSAPGSSVVRAATSVPATAAPPPPRPPRTAPVRRTTSHSGGPTTPARAATATGWTTRIGSRMDDSSDEDEAALATPGEGGQDEYARARRAFSSASKQLGVAIGHEDAKGGTKSRSSTGGGGTTKVKQRGSSAV